jgi:hypothetical protein
VSLDKAFVIYSHRTRKETEKEALLNDTSSALALKLPQADALGDKTITGTST